MKRDLTGIPRERASNTLISIGFNSKDKIKKQYVQDLSSISEKIDNVFHARTNTEDNNIIVSVISGTCPTELNSDKVYL